MAGRKRVALRHTSPECASRRPLPPYQQGALDGLCGVYAVTNGMALLCPELTHEACRRLFQVVLRGQLEASTSSVASLCKGGGRRKLRRLLRMAVERVSEVHRIPVRASWLGTNPKTLNARLDTLEVELVAGHIVIAGLSGGHRHWTVIERMTPDTLWLADSDGLACCGGHDVRCSFAPIGTASIPARSSCWRDLIWDGAKVRDRSVSRKPSLYTKSN